MPVTGGSSRIMPVQITGSSEVSVTGPVALSVDGKLVSQPNPIPVGEPLVQWRYDMSNSASFYAGYAPCGASTGSAVWNVKRTDFDQSGNPLTVRWAIGVAWSAYLDEEYS